MKKNYFKTSKFFAKLDKRSGSLVIKHLFTLTSLCFSLGVQAQFTEQTGTDNPFNSIDIGSQSAPIFIDLDNDSDLDFVSGINSGFFRYYTNNGSNIFTLQTGMSNPFAGIEDGGFSKPTFADLDNDSDLDLIVGVVFGTIKYYQNDGSNVFTQQTETNNPFDAINQNSGGNKTPRFVDLDNDADLDLVSGNSYGTYIYYLNNGSNVFSEQTGTDNPFDGFDVGSFSSPTFADLDNDGDLDLVSGNINGTFNYYTNNGNNVFTELTGTNNPFNGIDIGDYSNPTFVDLDNDGDLDLICGTSDGTFKYFTNNQIILSTETVRLDNVQLLLYPNPASTILNIELQTPLKQIDIYNLRGQNVMQSFLTQVNVSNLSNGIYLVKIEDKNGFVSTKRFIKN